MDDFQTPVDNRKTHNLPPNLPYSKLVAPHAKTRGSEADKCPCSVCRIAGTFSRHDKSALISSIFSTSETEKQELNKSPAKVKLQCVKCLTYIGRGKSHKCIRKTKQENLSMMVKASSRRTKGKVTSSCLKSDFADAGVKTRGGWHY